MIQFFEEDSIEELEALQVYEDISPWPAVDTVDINSIISAQDADGMDDESSVSVQWYESLW